MLRRKWKCKRWALSWTSVQTMKTTIWKMQLRAAVVRCLIKTTPCVDLSKLPPVSVAAGSMLMMAALRTCLKETKMAVASFELFVQVDTGNVVKCKCELILYSHNSTFLI